MIGVSAVILFDLDRSNSLQKKKILTRKQIKLTCFCLWAPVFEGEPQTLGGQLIGEAVGSIPAGRAVGRPDGRSDASQDAG